MDLLGIMTATSNLVNLGAWYKFVSNQVTKQSAEDLHSSLPPPSIYFLEKQEFWLLVTQK